MSALSQLVTIPRILDRADEFVAKVQLAGRRIKSSRMARTSPSQKLPNFLVLVQKPEFEAREPGYTRHWRQGRHMLGPNYFNYVMDSFSQWWEYGAHSDYIEKDAG